MISLKFNQRARSKGNLVYEHPVSVVAITDFCQLCVSMTNSYAMMSNLPEIVAFNIVLVLRTMFLVLKRLFIRCSCYSKLLGTQRSKKLRILYTRIVISLVMGLPIFIYATAKFLGLNLPYKS